VAGAITYPVLSPTWFLSYSGVNVTGSVADMVTMLEYTDKEQDHSDELEFTFSDRLKKWQGPWVPTRGDMVVAQIGYQGNMLDCGTFQVDELELKGPPDTFHLKCIAAGVTEGLRTKRSVGYEGAQTLLDVANVIAQRDGLILVGAPENINFTTQRVTQHHEDDLHFLHRLSWKYNYDFSVRGNKIIFYSRTQLEAQLPVATIDRTNCKSFTFTLKSAGLYQKANASYLNPDQKTLISGSDTDMDSPVVETRKIVSRLESHQQAQLAATAALHGANMAEVTAKIEVVGDPVIQSGVNVDITGFGIFSAQWLVMSSRHRLERASGYTTEFEARQL